MSDGNVQRSVEHSKNFVHYFRWVWVSVSRNLMNIVGIYGL